jgi:hypothetical protein
MLEAGCSLMNNASVNIPRLSFCADEKNLGKVKPDCGPLYPDVNSIDPWLALNSTIFRFPVLWNYIQPTLRGDLNSDVMTSLSELVNRVTSHRKYAIIDIVSYPCTLSTSAERRSV